jgi:hypothetical protein
MTSVSRFLARIGGAGLAALAGAALLAPEAAAKPSTYKADMGPGPAAAGTEATGKVTLKTRPRGDRVKLRVRNLEPRAGYEVRDSVTSTFLASFRTNARGHGKASFSADLLSAGGGVGLGGLPIEVVAAGGGLAVLEGNVPDDGKDDGGGGDDGGRPDWDEYTYRIGFVESGQDADAYVSIAMSSVGGPDMDAPYDAISLFVSDNGVYYAADGSRGEGGIAGPVAFWIADGEGTLQQVAEVEEAGSEWCWPADGDGGGDGTDRMGVSFFVEPGTDCKDVMPAGYFSWYADNSSEGGLPFGVGSVEDLSGRAFEVRDGDGNLLLEGTLPELETIDCTPPDPGDWTYEVGEVATGEDASVQVSIVMTSTTSSEMEGSYDTISLSVSPNLYWAMGGMWWEGDRGGYAEIPGPVTLWIAGEDGELVGVARVEASDWGYPMDGGNGVSYPETGADGMWYDPSWNPQFFFWYADNASGDGLPLGASSVKRLSGRAFEVRDGEGTVLLSGELPALEEVEGGDVRN